MQQYHDSIYSVLLLSRKLNSHLEGIGHSANERFDLLMNQYAEQEGVTEKVRRLNSIRNRVEETVFNKLIYPQKNNM